MIDTRTFHARLSAAVRGPGARIIQEGYSSRLWCAGTWHVREPLDMKGRYHADGPCTCTKEVPHD